MFTEFGRYLQSPSPAFLTAARKIIFRHFLIASRTRTMSQIMILFSYTSTSPSSLHKYENPSPLMFASCKRIIFHLTRSFHTYEIAITLGHMHDDV